MLITKQELFSILTIDPNEESVYKINLEEKPIVPKQVNAELDSNEVVRRRNLEKEYLMIDLRDPWQFEKIHIKDCSLCITSNQRATEYDVC